MLPNPTTGLGPFWIQLEKIADAFLNFLALKLYGLLKRSFFLDMAMFSLSFLNNKDL